MIGFPQIVKPQRNRGWLPGGVPRIDWSNPITAGLIAYYLPGLCFGFDLVGLNSGSIVGAPSVQTGRFGNSLALDGSTTYLTVNSNPSQSPPSISLNSWIKPAALANSYSAIISKNAGILPNLYQILVKSSGKLAVYIGNSDYDGTGTHTLAVGAWYQVGATASVPSGIIGYVNGQKDGSAVLSSFGPSTAALTIGRDTQSSGRIFNGNVLQGIVHGRVLSAVEEASLYADPFQLLIFPTDIIHSMMTRNKAA